MFVICLQRVALHVVIGQIQKRSVLGTPPQQSQELQARFPSPLLVRGLLPGSKVQFPCVSGFVPIQSGPCPSHLWVCGDFSVKCVCFHVFKGSLASVSVFQSHLIFALVHFLLWHRQHFFSQMSVLGTEVSIENSASGRV